MPQTKPPVIHVLGGAGQQVKTVRRARELGYDVVISDRAENPPARAWATWHERVDTTDIAANVRIARRYAAKGLLTIGTDRPIQTIAAVCEQLSLPAYLSVESAKLVTDKSLMKRRFVEIGIPTARFVFIRPGELAPAADLRFPVVVKPSLGQGQEGVLRVESRDDLPEAVRASATFSAEGLVVAEEFLEGPEITISAWVEDGRATIMMVTDRILHQPAPPLGVCLAHVYPSASVTEGNLPEMETICQGIAGGFGIRRGPLYIQAMCTPFGVKVVEVAARVGGGHEDDLIEHTRGFDVRRRLVLEASGAGCTERFGRFGVRNLTDPCAAVVFLVGRAGEVEAAESVMETAAREDILDGGFYLEPGDFTRTLAKGNDRIGYVMVQGATRPRLVGNIQAAMASMGIRDESGESLLVDYTREEWWLRQMLAAA
jgi:biotin carboxylase